MSAQTDGIPDIDDTEDAATRHPQFDNDRGRVSTAYHWMADRPVPALVVAAVAGTAAAIGVALLIKRRH